jgi:large subunit ribosomal protein L7/L12
MSEKLEKIVEEVQGLTLLEASELITLLEERLGVSAAAPVAVAATPAAGAGAEPEEEKTEFDVILKEIGPKKIQVIKVVRQITPLGLKEAKELVDSAPGPILEAVPREQAEDIKARLEAQSAVVEIK